VVAGEGQGEELEARLTRYLIADDVEVVNRSGGFRLVHWMGDPPAMSAGVEWRAFPRFGVAGWDGWIPVGSGIEMPGEAMPADRVETLRVFHGIPAWGSELIVGMLPPEAGLEATDIAYDKGCYIGQEVISRIKSAGKVNRLLHRFLVREGSEVRVGEVFGADGRGLGEITSIAPLAADGMRAVLGYVRRGVEPAQVVAAVE
jgi:folate-binding protein YgfZ